MSKSDVLFREAIFALGATRLDGMPKDGRPEVAFVGRSNVGKSSLLNALTGRRALARVSRTPGKTREANFFLAGDAFYLVDLPGLGYAKFSQTERDRWARTIAMYATEREPLRLLLHLVDSRHPPTALDEAVMGAVDPARYGIVLTKADKLSGNGRAAALKPLRSVLSRYGLEAAPVVLTSAEDGRGMEDLRRLILKVTREAGKATPLQAGSLSSGLLPP